MLEAKKISLFIFAHQDDEFGVFHKIVDELLNRRRVYCVYLTDGVLKGCSSKVRNRESVSVLKKLGVFENDIYFVGDILSISDGRLIGSLKAGYDWLKYKIIELNVDSEVASIYTPAWEGGHPDHDAAHAITVAVANKLDITSHVHQFSLYNGYKCFGKFFNVMTIIPTNGPVVKSKLQWSSKFYFLYLCLNYPSQAKTWLGLFPFVVLKYLISGNQLLQSVSIERLQLKPHNGQLYYEARGFIKWDEFSEKLRLWMNND